MKRFFLIEYWLMLKITTWPTLFCSLMTHFPIIDFGGAVQKEVDDDAISGIEGRSTWAPFSGSRSKNVQCVAQEEMNPLNHSFQNCKPFQNRLSRYREFATRK